MDKLILPKHENTFNRLAMPRIYPVKAGSGDQMHIVAPKAHNAEAKPYGALIDGKEYVFCSASEVKASDGPATFLGTAGYARENQLALFQGTRIGMSGFELRRDGGDFGLSAAMEQNRIVGRIVGRSGGKVFVVPPGGLDPAAASATVNGKPVPHTVEQGAVAFVVDIAQKDGMKNYVIHFAK
jgi:hypothetical protein